MQYPISKDQIINFILHTVEEDQQKHITEAINTDTVTKEMYLFEKRKYDVERYLDDEMNLGERFEIEELIKINPRLFDYHELSKDVNDFLQIEAFKRQLENIHYEFINPNQNREPEKLADETNMVKDITIVRKLKHNVLKVGKWVAAASIILLVSFGGINTYLNSKENLEERLYNNYYEPFNATSNSYFKSASIVEAKDKYNNQEYNIAWILLENLPNSVVIEADKTLYAGLTLMELERYQEAIIKFKSLQTVNTDQNSFKSISQWYLALCYLKLEMKADAIKILESITTYKSYNHKKANKILTKLNS
jgi:tetratricopeptide (TPR) repeat protein